VKIGEIYGEFKLEGIDQAIDSISTFGSTTQSILSSQAIPSVVALSGEISTFGTVALGVLMGFSSAFAQYFINSIKNGIKALSDLAEASVQSFADVERNLKLASIMSGEDLDNLMDVAKEVSTTFGFTQQEISKTALELARMGLQGEDLVNALKVSAEASIATGEKIEDLAGYIMSIRLVFGGTFREIANKLVQAANLARGTAKQIGYSISFIAPYAKQVGLTVDQTLAWVVALNNMGITTYRASFWIRNALMQLVQGDRNLINAMTELGISIKEGNRALTNTGDIIKRIRDSISTLPVDEAKQKLIALGEALGISFGKLDLDTVISQVRKQLNELPKAFRGAKLNQIAYVLGIHIPESMKSLSDRMKYFFMELKKLPYPLDTIVKKLSDLGIKITPKIGRLTDIMKILGDTISKKFKEGSMTAEEMSKLFEQFGLKVDFSGGKLINFFDLIDKLREKFKAGEITIDELSEVLTKALGIGAGAVLPLIQMSDETYQKFKEMQGVIDQSGKQFDVLGEQAKKMTETTAISLARLRANFQALLIELGRSLAPGVNKIVNSLMNLVKNLSPVITEIFGSIGDAFQIFIDTLFTRVGEEGKSIIEEFVSFLAENSDKIKEIAKSLAELVIRLYPLFEGFIEFIMEVLPPILDTVNGVIRGIVGAIDNFHKAWDTNYMGMRDTVYQFIDTFSEMSEAFSSLISYLKDTFGPAFKSTIDFLSQVFQGLFLAINTTLQLILTGIKVFLQVIQGKWSEAGETIKEFTDNNLKTLEDLWKGWGEDTLKIVTNALSGIGTAIGNWFKDILGKVGKWLGDLVSGFTKAFNNIVGNALSSMTNLGEGLVWGSLIPDMVKDIGKWLEYGARQTEKILPKLTGEEYLKKANLTYTPNIITTGARGIGEKIITKPETINVNITIEQANLNREEDIDILARKISEILANEIYSGVM